MCGIAGFSLNPEVRPDVEQLTRAALLGIEERGRDAAGIAWHDGIANELWYYKEPVAASKMLTMLGEGEPHGARSAVLHTRYATHGSPSQPVNNHPIENNGCVGVHNGVIRNHNAIFDLIRSEVPNAKRHGEVDSEAFVALMGWRDALKATPGELLELMEGSASVAWLEVDDTDHTLHLARCGGSPLWVGRTKRGSVLFASTEHTLKKAAMAGGFRFVQAGSIPEGTYLKVVGGEIVEQERFAPTVATYVKPQYNRPSAYEAPRKNKKHHQQRIGFSGNRGYANAFNDAWRNAPQQTIDRDTYGLTEDERAYLDYLDATDTLNRRNDEKEA